MAKEKIIKAITVGPDGTEFPKEMREFTESFWNELQKTPVGRKRFKKIEEPEPDFRKSGQKKEKSDTKSG